MNKFLDKFFAKQPKHNHLQITNILEAGGTLIMIFPDNNLICFQILEIVVGWQNLFSRFVFVLSSNQLKFFSKQSTLKKIEYLVLEKKLQHFHQSIIVNFNRAQFLTDYFRKCRSLIIDINNQGNIQFDPQENDEFEFFTRFLDFSHLPGSKQKLTFSFSRAESQKARHNFFQNRFLNFTIDIREQSVFRHLESMITILKQNFPINIYLTGKTIKKNPFLNVRNLETNDLLQLYYLAQQSKIFFSDKFDLVKLFRKLDLVPVYLNETVQNREISILNPANSNKIKAMVAGILK